MTTFNCVTCLLLIVHDLGDAEIDDFDESSPRRVLATMMLSGFSRGDHLEIVRVAQSSAACRTISAIRAGGSRRRGRLAESGCPTTNSMARKTTPSASPESYTLQRFDGRSGRNFSLPLNRLRHRRLSSAAEDFSPHGDDFMCMPCTQPIPPSPSIFST